MWTCASVDMKTGSPRGATVAVKRAITIHDFQRDWQNWSGVQG
jgi:hypothetical protein